MDKQKLSKQSLKELMDKVGLERQQALENFHKYDGAFHQLRYLMDKFEIENLEEIELPNGTANGL